MWRRSARHRQLLVDRANKRAGRSGQSLLAEEYALHFGAAYPGGVFCGAYGNDDCQSRFGCDGREALRTDQVRRWLSGWASIHTG